MQEKFSILLIEDNQDIQDAVSLIFEIHWPDVHLYQAFSGSKGIALLRKESPDMLILDLGLPDTDGLKVLREVRSFSNIPVIILTVRGEQIDKIRGLELGADDFIVKPFTHKELLARVRSVFSRSKSFFAEEVKLPATSSGLKIDFNNGNVVKAGRKFKLSSTELNLLKYLAANKGKVISGKDILKTIWGEEYVDCEEDLQAYIRGLREKLEDDPANPKLIITDNSGYRYMQPSF